MTEPSYAELHCHSYFSLLDGASSPEALVEQATALGLHSLALTDHDSLAGAVRFWKAAERAGIQPIFGAEVTLEDHTHLTLLAENQQGYSNLCRIITASRLDQVPALDNESTWPGKVAPALRWERLAQHADGLIVLTGCRQGVLAQALATSVDAAMTVVYRLQELYRVDQLYLELQQHGHPSDDVRLSGMTALAARTGLPLVATNNVHYAMPEGSRLRDVLIATHHNLTLTAARRAGLLPISSDYAMASPSAMAAKFADLPQALHTTIEIAIRCHVSLDFSQQRVPFFPTPNGETAYDYLYELCHSHLRERYPDIFRQVISQMAHELEIIDRAQLCGYFLMVWDIVREAQSRGIRCQGRGSAANSIVAYVLGITNVDPLRHNLLFERFLSEDRFTCPDIDLDFDASRRDEVIQYVYQRYGREHAAMVCNFVTYQAPSALRDLGKALTLPEAVIEDLARGLDTFSPKTAAEQIAAQVPMDAPVHHSLRLLSSLMAQIDGCPRHLGIHSGGMLITAARLDEIVPLEPATMGGRIVAQWDKDCAEDAGLIKLDLLGLRMLGVLSDVVKQVESATGTTLDLNRISLDDPAIYAMLQKADTIGAFQVESRAQQQMLPRLKPTKFEDIIIEIAIIRPGPIQGNMVHPYLRRRARLEPVTYPHPLLEQDLAETLGVLLFQEQVLRVAMKLAGFSAGEADLLRRALTRSRPGDEMDLLRNRFITGAKKQDIEAEAAADIFAQLSGYAGYGFCKSHSASFALIAYQSLYLKHYYPAEFYCALLNHQPMGFYSSEVLSGDARRHGIDVLPPDIHQSEWGYTIVYERERRKLRTGLNAVKGMGEAGYAQISTEREKQPFTDLRDLLQRSGLSKRIIANLIRAGALEVIGERRQLLWELGPLDEQADGLDLDTPILEGSLPQLHELEETIWEYELLGHAPGGNLLRHYREMLRQTGVLSTWQVKHDIPAGKRVSVGGMVVVRQRPGTAKGMLFISLEDESGLLDLVVRPNVYTRLQTVLRHQPLIIATGMVQRAEGATSFLVQEAVPLPTQGEQF